MPLSRLQLDILRLLAAHRDPESFIAGSTPLNRGVSRSSDDIDIFHDREERVARAAEEDSATLQAHGLEVKWLRREPALYTAEVLRGTERTHLEWVVDSDFRFFPVMKDDLFGYALHPVDLSRFITLSDHLTVRTKNGVNRGRPMATETIEAVYEHGGFRPINPMDIDIAEGQKVRLVVEPIEKPDDILALAAQVYEDLSEEEIELIEQHTRRRDDFFGESPSS